MSEQEQEGNQSGAKRKGAPAGRIKGVLISLLVGVLVGAGATLFLTHYNPPDKPAESNTLEASAVFERVIAQNEMVSATQKYNLTEKDASSRKIPFTDVDIPFTGNSYWYRYKGTLKYGVNLQNASFKQDASGKAITVSLDAPYVISNTPDMESTGVLEENNNILNPIHVEQVDALQKQCVAKSEETAIADGVLEVARENAEDNIRAMFNAALGDDCEIAIHWRDQ